jgi:hypothetical protein
LNPLSGKHVKGVLGAAAAAVNLDQIVVEIRTRDGLLGDGSRALAAAARAAIAGKKPYKVEMR